jgi:hypothetical protein
MAKVNSRTDQHRRDQLPAGADHHAGREVAVKTLETLHTNASIALDEGGALAACAMRIKDFSRPSQAALKVPARRPA